MKQNTEKVELMTCPVCGKANFRHFLSTKDYFLTNEKFNLDKCNHCDHVFTNPIPTLSTLSKYYDSPDYLSHTAAKWSITSSVYKLLRNQNIKNKYDLVKSFKQGNSILDIGQGTGELLNYFKQKGWDVKGVEPNERAREFATTNYGTEVFDEPMLDKFEANRFDVISLWHVMEHVHDLGKRLKQITRLLDQNGYLFVAVPNIESPDSVKYGEKWAGLDVPRHLSHFTKKSMEYLLNMHDFKLIKMVPMKFDAYYVSLLSEKYLKNKLAILSAFSNGYRSNREAKRENNYSSMIFVAKQK